MAEQHSFRVEGVVLRHADWGETDRLITLYTRERGKLRVIAKGVRRIRSRKAGHLEPFTRVTLQLARSHDLPIVTQADTLDAYLPVHENLGKTGQAAYIVELIDRFTYEDDTENYGVFRLLTEVFTRLETEPDPWLAIRYYEVHLLDLLGYRPHWFECANCGREIKAEDQFFSPARGGVLCPSCGRSLPGSWPISVEALKYLRHFQRSTYSEARRAKPPSPVQAEVEALLQRYVTYLLERALNSPRFISQINQ